MLAVLAEIESEEDTDSEPQSARSAGVITIPPEGEPPVTARTRESRRPTVALPRVGGDFFEKYVGGIAQNAKTEAEKEKVRGLIEIGQKQNLLDDAAVLRLRLLLGD